MKASSIRTNGRHQQVEVLPASLAISALPKAYFNGHFTMVISGDPENGGFVPETVSYPIEWRWGKTKGSGLIRVTPLSTWTSELEIKLDQPKGLAALIWDEQRLSQVAQEVALGVRKVIEQVYSGTPVAAGAAEREPVRAGSTLRPARAVG